MKNKANKNAIRILEYRDVYIDKPIMVNSSGYENLLLHFLMLVFDC